MKMQIVSMSLNGNNFQITRKLVNTKNRHENDYASCSIIVLEPMFCCKSGFIASGFASLESPIMEHDVDNINEDINGFIKAVFSK